MRSEGRNAGIYHNLPAESHTKTLVFIHNIHETKRLFAARAAGRTVVTTEERFVMLGVVFIEMQPTSPSTEDPFGEERTVEENGCSCLFTMGVLEHIL